MSLTDSVFEKNEAFALGGGLELTFSKDVELKNLNIS